MPPETAREVEHIEVRVTDAVFGELDAGEAHVLPVYHTSKANAESLSRRIAALKEHNAKVEEDKKAAAAQAEADKAAAEKAAAAVTN